MTTSGVIVTVVNPPITKILIPGTSEATIVTQAGNASILATNAKLDRIVQMVTSSQAAMQCSIEQVCSTLLSKSTQNSRKSKKKQPSRPPKKAHLSEDLSFRKKGHQFRFNEEMQEHLISS